MINWALVEDPDGQQDKPEAESSAVKFAGSEDLTGCEIG